MQGKIKHNSLDKLITTAASDTRLGQLIAHVETSCKLVYQPSNNEYWGSSLENGIAQIFVSPTTRPAACLAHELLHIKVQLLGIRQIRIGFWSLDPDGRFSDPLNNELQHHRMFQSFVDLGFPPAEFFHDYDRHTEQHLRRDLASGYPSLLDAAIGFFTVLAPGGLIEERTRQELANEFLNLNQGDFRPGLSGMRAAIQAWANSDSYDIRVPVKQICQALQHPCIAWYGFSDDDKPPFDGFFVGREFELEAP